MNLRLRLHGIINSLNDNTRITAICNHLEEEDFDFYFFGSKTHRDKVLGIDILKTKIYTHITGGDNAIATRLLNYMDDEQLQTYVESSPQARAKAMSIQEVQERLQVLV